MEEKIILTPAQINAVYNEASLTMKNMLDSLFEKAGETVPDNRPVTERIKTFEDAVKELGENNVLVQAYNAATFAFNTSGNWNDTSDVVAYLKLRIIVAALNEGWTPEFVKGEYRWSPYFVLYTNKELEELSEEDKSDISPCRVVGRSYNGAYASGGLAYAYARNASSSSNSGYGSRLAFKSEELAEYAGKQFIDIYAQMIGLKLT